MNSVALLLVVLLLLLLGVMTAELVGPTTSLDLDFDSDLDLDLDVDLDVDLKAGHQEQAPEVSSEIGREPRAADEDSDKDKDSDSTPANAEKAGAEAAEEFSKVGEGQGRRKLPTSCTTAGVATCFASASNGDELELSAGTLSSTDGIESTVQLTLRSKYASIACSADGGACVWQGATGKRVVYIRDNGGTSTLSHLVVKDGDGSHGGGLYVYNSNVVLILVAFIDNAASYGLSLIHI